MEKAKEAMAGTDMKMIVIRDSEDSLEQLVGGDCQIAVLPFCSDTTGLPKGVQLTHRQTATLSLVEVFPGRSLRYQSPLPFAVSLWHKKRGKIYAINTQQKERNNPSGQHFGPKHWVP